MADETPGSQPYDPATDYVFRLMQSVRVDGVRLSRAEEHQARGEFLNRIVAQEGRDVIDSARPR
ncbi:hypothetical protein ACT6QG_05225 [Xanthobacter sp. TB0136]|uniref:hypothetical protein n=1 Tax=Xanthobacter sp. TB0136 TaxID=3459177 RepID=UPI004039A142